MSWKPVLVCVCLVLGWSLTATTLVPGLVTPINGGALNATVVPIDTSGGYEQQPRVSGDIACYGDSSNFEVRYYRFSTAVNLIADGGAQCSIDGPRIAYSSDINQIRIFDVNTATSTEVDHQAGTRRFETALAANTLAFFDYFFTSPTIYTSTSLRVADPASPNQSQLLSNSGRIERGVKASPAGDLLVWAIPDANDYDQVVKSIRTNGVWSQPQLVGNVPSVPNEFPDTDGQHIVWAVDEATIAIQPVSGGQVSQLDLPGFSMDASISHGVVAFRHDDLAGGSSLPGDIMIYVIATNTLYRLTNTPTVTEDHPDIEVLPNGQWRVVWEEFDTGFTYVNIKAATFNAPNTTSTTVSNLSSSPNPSTIGQTVTLSVTVSGSSPLTGNVAFYDTTGGKLELGQATVSGNVAQLLYSGLAVGSHQITAKYLGDQNGNQESLETLPRSHQVNPSPSTIVVSSSKNPSLVGDAVTLTAGVSGVAPTGTVTFFVDGVQSGSPVTLSLSFTATRQINLAAGQYAITANYSGDVNNLPAVTAPTIVQRVEVGQSSGTAVRAIVTGRSSPAGANFAKESQPLGGFAIDAATPSTFITDVGTSSARAWLPNWPLNAGPFVSAYSTEVGFGASGSRAIAYATYVNQSSQTVTAPADADLHGNFFTGTGLGQASGAVYVFDRDLFLSKIAASNKTLPQLLLGGALQTTLDAWAVGDEATLSLVNLFDPAAKLTPPAFQTVSSSNGLSVNSTLHASFTVDPGKAVVIVFDLTVYTPTDSGADFSGTLKPAPSFLKDPNGNALPLVAVGLTSAEPPPLANLVLTPAAATNPLGTPVTVTGTATTAQGAPVANTQVFLEIIAGPNAQPIGPAVTDPGGHISFTYSGGSTTGTDQVRASVGSLQSNIAQLTWTAASVNPFTFQGFFSPIDMSTGSTIVWNTAKAGQAIPVKWLLTLNGAPVTSAASFLGLSSYKIACSSGTGTVDDAIDEKATGGSGLQNNGGGNWQFNWQTLASYKNSCRAVVVRFSDGTTSPPANFKFK